VEVQRPRRTRRPTGSTSLSDVLDERNVEIPMKLHTGVDHEGFWLNLESSTSTVNGYSSNILGGIDLKALDVPQPTENGGYSHTKASKAKIGAANKGKIPWNKGRERSPEEKARIAAGVRARNRENFMQQLSEMGITEEEYEERKKDERRNKDAERRARRTENGGYRPTDETRAKISKILKEKHARGEITRRAADPSKVRRGFTQSEETKRKISESLRMRWSKDTEYRDRMTTTMKTTYSKVEVRQKVSETLKKKWQDPQFRQEMLEKMNKRRKSPDVSDEYRQKISTTMKKKWQDPEYRAKTLDAIAKHSDSVERKPRTRMPTGPRASGKPKVTAEVRMIQPLANGETRSNTARQKIPTKRSTPSPLSQKIPPSSSVTASGAPQSTAAEKKAILAKKKAEPDGSVNRLREERRDLFDLLYGDEQFDEESEGRETEVDSDSLLDSLSTRFDFGDEDLDSFDPYGLDDY
jgi:NUMOD3 motif